VPASGPPIRLVLCDKLNPFGDERLQLFIGHVAKFARRPNLRLLHGLAITTIKERARSGNTRGLALTFVAYRRKSFQSIIGELASSLSQFSFLLRRGNDNRRRARCRVGGLERDDSSAHLELLTFRISFGGSVASGVDDAAPGTSPDAGLWVGGVVVALPARSSPCAGAAAGAS
jgi:hypothetical protein